MEAKVVVGTKAGKSYNIEVKDDLAAVFVGKHVGDVVNVTPLGLKGYEVKITGGSDKQGFPMRKDLHILGRTKALMSTRTQGYKFPGDGIRARKTVVGNIIDERVSQINTMVVKEGKDSIEKLLGLDKAVEGEVPTEGAAPKKEDPVGPTREERKEAEKKEQSKEEPKEEAPTQTSPEVKSGTGSSKDEPREEEAKPEESKEEKAEEKKE